jgi:hypothetical protein
MWQKQKPIVGKDGETVYNISDISLARRLVANLKKIATIQHKPACAAFDATIGRAFYLHYHFDLPPKDLSVMTGNDDFIPLATSAVAMASFDPTQHTNEGFPLEIRGNMAFFTKRELSSVAP